MVGFDNVIDVHSPSCSRAGVHCNTYLLWITTAADHQVMIPGCPSPPSNGREGDM